MWVKTNVGKVRRPLEAHHGDKMLLLYFLSKYLFDLTFVNKYSITLSLLTSVVWNEESFTSFFQGMKKWKISTLPGRNLFSC